MSNVRFLHVGAPQATVAEYFRIGVELGIVSPDEPRAWADAIIREHAHPLGEVIEVSWSKGTAELLEALRAIPGERDCKLAGAWLLGLLATRLQESAEPRAIARSAMQVARVANMGDGVYYEFDVVDDQFSLAELGRYGTDEACRAELEEALAKYPVRPAGT
jgi:hypothetical protein